MRSIVFHNKTGKVYWLIDLWCVNATNGHESERFALYRRILGRKHFIRRVSEFSCKFTHWKEWLKNGGKCNGK